MDITKLNQSAGDNSIQIQNHGDIIVGMPPEIVCQVIQMYGECARVTVENRIKQFSDDYLMPRIKNLENGLEAFRDPGFQMQLVEATKKAASTERKIDYSMLAELMAARFSKRDDIKSNAVIAKAVEGVNLIDNDSLVGLTLIFFVSRAFKPSVGPIHEGLKLLDDCVAKILSSADLSIENKKWIDNLEITQTLKTYRGIGSLKSFTDIYTSELSGYVVAGVEKDSEKHVSLQKKLELYNLSADFLVEHEFDSTRIRLNVAHKRQIQEMEHLSNEQKVFLLGVFDEMTKTDIKKDMKSALDTYITENCSSLSLLREFWNTIPPLELTALGSLIGYMNLKRLLPKIQDKEFDFIQ